MGKMAIVFGIIGLLGLAGYVMNIIHIYQLCCNIIDGAMVVRAIGVFIPPVGAFAGWLL